jgi:ABC-type multidrug transport system ATPase subunit/ABC-type multidrug transport system permease subunit
MMNRGLPEEVILMNNGMTPHSMNGGDALKTTDFGCAMEGNPKAHVTLEWRQVELSIKTKHILRGIDGIAEPGRILAIMGPSGSGKTSLLHCLAGRRRGMTGEVRLNGAPTANHQVMRTNAGFVPQEDLLLGFLTVEESIQFSADLQLKAPAEQRRKMVDQVIRNSGLDGVRKTKVGSQVVRGVSGGEKRRVSIAVEVVGFKPLLFLDEPTSGLDSAAAFQVVKFLKRLTRNLNTTVVATIHQPSVKVFELFDDLLILAYGDPVYFGTAGNLERHMNSLGYQVPPHETAAEFVLDLINADFADDPEPAKEQIREISARSMQQCPIPAAQTGYGTLHTSWGAGFCSQLIVLLKRGFVNAVRNWVYYWARIAMFLALALLAGTVWFDLGNSFASVQNRFGVLFFIVAFPCFMAVAGIPGFLEERSVIMRELHAGYYSSFLYALSSLITSLPFIILLAFSFCAVQYYLNGLNPPFERWITYTGVFFSAIWCAENFMLVFPALVPIFVIALTLAAFANGFVMMLQGYFVRFDDIPKFWIWGHYISYQKYAFEALCKNEFDGLVFNCDRTSTGACNCFYLDDLQSSCQFRGETVLAAYGYEDVSIVAWVMVLLGMAFIYRIIFWLLVEWHAHRGLK